jgi:voltage-gated potassium channel
MRGLLHRIHAAFHRPDTGAHRATSVVVWVLIALSIPLVAATLLLPEDSPLSNPVRLADRIVLSLFAVELALRVLSFRPPTLSLFRGNAAWRLRAHLFGRLRYLLTPLLLIDLLAVLALVPALRGLRALRLLRLVRLSKLFRYSSPIMGVVRAFQENALLYIFTFVFLLSVVILGGVSMFLVEARAEGSYVKSISEGIWWALVTLTTVGYGDFTPVTPLGRVVAGTVMVLGMFTLALFAGIVGSTLLRVLVGLRQDQFRMSSYTGHIVICGYDRAAPLLLNAVLAEVPEGESELVVFGKGERPDDLPPEFIWVGGDPSKESELEKVRLTHARAAIVIASRQVAPLDHAYTAGADEVIETTRLGFALIARAAVVPGSGTIMGSVASAGAHSLYIATAPVGEALRYSDLTRRLHDEYGAVLIGIREPATSKVTIGPGDDLLVDPSWQVVYLARGPVIHETREEAGA